MILFLSGACDHDIADGVAMARFGRRMAGRTLYPGQQMDVFISADSGEKAVSTEEVSRR